MSIQGITNERRPVPSVLLRFLMVISVVALAGAGCSGGTKGTPTILISKSGHSSLVSAISQSGSAQITLIIDEPLIITSDTVIPANVTILVQPSGSINQGTYRLTINGPFSARTRSSVYRDGSGQFGDGSVQEVYPQWWGPNSAASVNSALQAFHIVFCSKGVYPIEEAVRIPAGRTLKGEPGTIFQRPADTVYLQRKCRRKF